LDENIYLLSIDNMSLENLSDLRTTWQNTLQLLQLCPAWAIHAFRFDQDYGHLGYL